MVLEKASWTDRVKNKVLHIVREERNILHTITRMKTKFLGHILHMKCLIKHVLEGKMAG